MSFWYGYTQLEVDQRFTPRRDDFVFGRVEVDACCEVRAGCGEGAAFREELDLEYDLGSGVGL